mgnify:CR=1 FL=1
MAFKTFITLLAFSSFSFAGEIKLFPNDSLEGWHIVGPQISYTLNDGVLTGEGNERRNSFLTNSNQLHRTRETSISNFIERNLINTLIRRDIHH